MFAILGAESIGERLSEALLPEKVKFLGLMVSPSLITALAVSALIIIACVILRFTVLKNLKTVPKGIQLILEGVVSYFDNTAKEATHEYSKLIGPYIMTSAVFICLSTLVELVGIRPALADVNACLAFGIATFLVINFSGFKKKGLFGRSKRYFNPINIITDVAVPVSLSFRLFGSIVSGVLITELLYSFIWLSFGVPVIVAVITTLFHAFVQAYVFSTLSSLFVGEALE